jgi:hypothetical protein
MITREEIIKQLEYDKKYGVYKANFYSMVFNRPVKIWIFSDKDDRENDIDEVVTKRINSFLDLDSSVIEPLKNKIWSHFNSCIANIDYGFLPQDLINKNNGSIELANREYFDCRDSNDTFEKAELDYVYFSDVPNKIDIIFQFIFKVPWENEHGITMTLINEKVEYVD